MKIGDEGGQERILKRFLHTMYDPFANPISATPKYPNSRLTEPLLPPGYGQSGWGQGRRSPSHGLVAQARGSQEKGHIQCSHCPWNGVMILELSGVIVSTPKHPGGSSRPGLQSPWEGPPTWVTAKHRLQEERVHLRKSF